MEGTSALTRHKSERSSSNSCVLHVLVSMRVMGNKGAKDGVQMGRVAGVSLVWG